MYLTIHLTCESQVIYQAPCSVPSSNIYTCFQRRCRKKITGGEKNKRRQIKRIWKGQTGKFSI